MLARNRMKGMLTAMDVRAVNALLVERLDLPTEFLAEVVSLTVVASCIAATLR